MPLPEWYTSPFRYKQADLDQMDLYNKQIEDYKTAAEAYNAALDKYKSDVELYNERVNAWNAGPRTSDFGYKPPAEFTMAQPTALDFTQEDLDAFQQEAQARATRAQQARNTAYTAAINPSQYNLAGFSFADGGDVSADRAAFIKQWYDEKYGDSPSRYVVNDRGYMTDPRYKALMTAVQDTDTPPTTTTPTVIDKSATSVAPTVIDKSATSTFAAPEATATPSTTPEQFTPFYPTPSAELLQFLKDQGVDQMYLVKDKPDPNFRPYFPSMDNMPEFLQDYLQRTGQLALPMFAQGGPVDARPAYQRLLAAIQGPQKFAVGGAVMGPATQQLMAAMAPASQATDQGPIDTTAPFLPESVSNFINRNVSPVDMLGKYYSVISGGVISPEPKEVEKVDPYTNPGLTEEEKAIGATPGFQPPTVITAPTSLPAAEQLKGLPGFKPVEQKPEDLIMRSEDDAENTLRFSDKRFKQLTSEHEADPFDYPSGMVSAGVAWVNPMDVVNATTYGKEEIDILRKEVAEQGPTDMDILEGDILPYINIEKASSGDVKVTEQEGRHRMLRLADMGYTRVPVRFVNRNAESGETSLLDLPVSGQLAGKQKGSTSLPYENLVEITPQNRQLLKSEFGQPSNVDKIEVENGSLNVYTDIENQRDNRPLINDFLVKEDKRGQGIGTNLIKTTLEKYPNAGANASNEGAVKAMYRAGMRSQDFPRASEDALVEQVKENPVYMVANPKPQTYESDYFGGGVLEPEFAHGGEVTNFIRKRAEGSPEQGEEMDPESVGEARDMPTMPPAVKMFLGDVLLGWGENRGMLEEDISQEQRDWFIQRALEAKAQKEAETGEPVTDLYLSKWDTPTSPEQIGGFFSKDPGYGGFFSPAYQLRNYLGDTNVRFLPDGSMVTRNETYDFSPEYDKKSLTEWIKSRGLMGAAGKIGAEYGTREDSGKAVKRDIKWR